MTRFSRLTPDRNGQLVETDVREIPQNAMRACPHFIMEPGHYRNKLSNFRCRCDDPKHKVMESWGYTWDSTIKRWR